MAAVPDPATGVLMNDITIWRSIQSLDAKCVKAIWIMRLRGVSENQIAARMGLSAWDVWKVFKGAIHPETKTEAIRFVMSERSREPFRCPRRLGPPPQKRTARRRQPRLPGFR